LDGNPRFNPGWIKIGSKSAPSGPSEKPDFFNHFFFQKKKSVIQIITGSFSQGNSSGGFVPIQIAGWWFGTFGLFFHILGIII
jgi:hypothetical protein